VIREAGRLFHIRWGGLREIPAVSASAIPRRAAAAGAFRLTARLEWPLFRRKPSGTES